MHLARDGAKTPLKHTSFDSRGGESQYHRWFRSVSSFLLHDDQPVVY